MKLALLLTLFLQADAPLLEDKTVGLKIQLKKPRKKPKKGETVEPIWRISGDGRTRDTASGGKAREWQLLHSSDPTVVMSLKAVTKPDTELGTAWDLEQAADTETMNLKKRYGDRIKRTKKQSTKFGRTKERAMFLIFEALGGREVWVWIFEAKANENFYAVTVAGPPKSIKLRGRDIQLLFYGMSFSANEKAKK